jgi:hypothetical protein
MTALRLNLGCGQRKFPGYLNVDKYPECGPDQVVDLEHFPWPWPDDSVAEVRLIHVLEHLGASTAIYLGILRELWRVCRHGAEVHIVVPHPRHDSFLNDPTHVRPVTGDGLRMFSQAENRRWQAEGAANTPLGLYLGIDFELVSTQLELDPRWQQRLDAGETTREAIFEAILRENNVVRQATHLLRAIKGERQP